MTTSDRPDDFSCDPCRWSWDKLRREQRNGMAAARAEYERRLREEPRSEDEQLALARAH